tara:strand:- start:200 stop:481 length:282 start_codon:yes stop_codon:yes gene_type:complete
MERTKIVIGENGAKTVPVTDADIAQEKIDAESLPDFAWYSLRLQRDAKLSETDWWAMPDSPTMSKAQTQYRQDLRDLPSTVDINNIVWPTKPE